MARLALLIASVALLAAACTSDDTPPPTATPDVEASATPPPGGPPLAPPTPSPPRPEGEALADAKLTVSQNGRGCARPLFVRGASLPGNARLQLRWNRSNPPVVDVITTAAGSFHLWINDALPGDCGPASEYELSPATDVAGTSPALEHPGTMTLTRGGVA